MRVPFAFVLAVLASAAAPGAAYAVFAFAPPPGTAPEPGILLLLGAGVAGALGVRALRRKPRK